MNPMQEAPVQSVSISIFLARLQEVLDTHAGGTRIHLIDKQIAPHGWVVTFKDDLYPDKVFSKTLSRDLSIGGMMRYTNIQAFTVSIIDHDEKENERAVVRARWNMIHHASKSAEGKILVCILEKLEEISGKLK